jgi:hypothetical protein
MYKPAKKFTYVGQALPSCLFPDFNVYLLPVGKLVLYVPIHDFV